MHRDASGACWVPGTRYKVLTLSIPMYVHTVHTVHTVRPVNTVHTVHAYRTIRTYCTVLYCTVLHCTVQRRTVPYRTVSPHTYHTAYVPNIDPPQTPRQAAHSLSHNPKNVARRPGDSQMHKMKASGPDDHKAQQRCQWGLKGTPMQQVHKGPHSHQHRIVKRFLQGN